MKPWPASAKSAGNTSHCAYISLGSNVGDRREMIFRALRAMQATRGISLHRTSSLLETAAIGLPDQPAFLNAVAQVKTTLNPEALLETLRSIEGFLGRTRQRRWEPRSIDLDILFYDQKRMQSSTLTLPHPEIENRPYLKALLRQLEER